MDMSPDNNGDQLAGNTFINISGTWRQYYNVNVYYFVDNLEFLSYSF